MSHTFEMKLYTSSGLDWFLLFTTAASRKPARHNLTECLGKGSDLLPVLGRELQLSFHVVFVGRTLSTTTAEGQVPPSSLCLHARCDLICREREGKGWPQAQPRVLFSLTQTLKGGAPSLRDVSAG